jgi:hypothetical protein
MPGETKVEIVLTEESHQCLMDHVSESSSAFDPLQAAIHLHGYGTTAPVLRQNVVRLSDSLGSIRDPRRRR